jgi:RNA polymerase sigma-70 factor (ECF subfamily)
MRDESPGLADSPDALFARYRRTGDPAALAALFDATADGLYRVALALVPDPATAEDAVQETFLAVIEAAPRFDGTRPVLPWLIGILRNKAAYLRRREARSPDPARLRGGAGDGGPVHSAALRDDEDRVRAAIEELPESLRIPARMRWRDGLEPVEIARTVGARPGTVRMALARALRRLRASLGGMPAWVAAGEREPRGLAAVRGAVVRHATAAPLGAAAAVAAGGVLLAKKVAVGIAVVVLLLLAGRLAWNFAGKPGDKPPPGISSAAPSHAPIPRAAGAEKPGGGSGAAADTAAATPTSPPSEPRTGPAKAPPAEWGMTGRVVDGDRRPVKDAKVSFHLSDGKSVDATADADGGFVSPPLRLAGSAKYTIRVVARDGAGRVAMYTQSGGAYGPEGREIVLPRMNLPPLVLRPAASLTVLAVSGGAPLPGATVEVREETAMGGVATAAADGEGRAAFEGLPSGAWMVRAWAAGKGRGTTHVALPLAEAVPVEVAVSSRSLLVEVVTQGTGAPVEGVAIDVWEWWRSDGLPWIRPGDPPLLVPPTDSAGRTTVEGLSQGETVRILALGDEGRRLLGSAEADPGMSSVRIVSPQASIVRFAVSRDGFTPSEGTAITVDTPEGSGSPFKGLMEGADLVVSGLPPKEVRLLARAPDGSLAGLRAAAGASRGEPTAFRPPRKLEVRVVDPDGKPVTDSLVVVKDEKGRPLHPLSREHPDEDGRTLVPGLPAEEVVVCVLAHWDYGGAAAARADLREGDGRVEVRVGYEVEVVLRVRMGGEPRLPPEFSIDLQYASAGGFTANDRITDAREDAKSAEVRFVARPFPANAPIPITFEIPGWYRWAVDVPPLGGTVTLELPASKGK